LELLHPWGFCGHPDAAGPVDGEISLIDWKGSVDKKAAALQLAAYDRLMKYNYPGDRKSTRLNSSHEWISYAVFCLKKKKKIQEYGRLCVLEVHMVVVDPCGGGPCSGVTQKRERGAMSLVSDGDDV